MTLLFDRRYSATVQEVISSGTGSKAKVEVAPSFIPGLGPVPFVRCAFEVNKTNDSEANSAKITFSNLAAETRAKFKKNDLMSFNVGYADDSDDPLLLPSLIKGNIARSVNIREETGWSTEVTIGDGGLFFSTAKINDSLPSQIEIKEIYKRIEKRVLEAGIEVVEDLGESVESWLFGQFNKFLTNPNSTGTNNGGARVTDSPRLLVGSLSDVITQELDRVGLNWSIQDNVLYARPKGGSDNRAAILVNQNTGMVGSPDRNERGGISCKTKIIPGLDPGRKVRVESKVISGDYVVVETKTTGDTDGIEWDIEFDAIEEGADLGFI